jgi:hypothetical protein
MNDPILTTGLAVFRRVRDRDPRIRAALEIYDRYVEPACVTVIVVVQLVSAFALVF